MDKDLKKVVVLLAHPNMENSQANKALFDAIKEMLFYTGYLLYLGIPSFLNINKEEGLSFSSSTLAIGVLVLEVLLALTVILWGYGYRLF